MFERARSRSSSSRAVNFTLRHIGRWALMADPQIQNAYRAQLILQGVSDLPEDRYVTTWCFRNLTPGAKTHDQVADSIATVLSRFLGTDFTGGSVGKVADLIPRDLLSNQVHVGAIRVYHLGAPPPRTPFVRDLQGVTITNFSSSSSVLPPEVAMCLSFRAGDRPRERGRVYVGPLVAGTLYGTGAGAGLGGLFDATKTAILRDAGNALIDEAVAADIPWSVLSRAGSLVHTVVAGWVDNAPDIQRRRGMAATARDTFAA